MGKENWKMENGETAASFKKQFDGEPQFECHERLRDGSGTNCAYDMCANSGNSCRKSQEYTKKNPIVTDKHLE